MLTHDQIYERLYPIWLDLPGSDAKTKLGGLIADLEAETLEAAPTVLAEGWALPPHSYLMGTHLEDGENTVWFDQQIRVCLDRAPRGSRPVTITEGHREA